MCVGTFGTVRASREGCRDELALGVRDRVSSLGGHGCAVRAQALLVVSPRGELTAVAVRAGTGSRDRKCDLGNRTGKTWLAGRWRRYRRKGVAAGGGPACVARRGA